MSYFATKYESILVLYSTLSQSSGAATAAWLDCRNESHLRPDGERGRGRESVGKTNRSCAEPELAGSQRQRGSEAASDIILWRERASERALLRFINTSVLPPSFALPSFLLRICPWYPTKPNGAVVHHAEIFEIQYCLRSFRILQPFKPWITRKSHHIE